MRTFTKIEKLSENGQIHVFAIKNPAWAFMFDPALQRF